MEDCKRTQRRLDVNSMTVYVPSGVISRVALVRTDVSEKLSAAIIRVLVFLCNVRRLLVTANVFPSSPIHLTLMMALSCSETSVLTRSTRRNIPEDGTLCIQLRPSYESKGF
jgi:hypothetical protein